MGGLVCWLDFCVTSLNGVSLIAYVVALRWELLVRCISKVFLFGVGCWRCVLLLVVDLFGFVVNLLRWFEDWLIVLIFIFLFSFVYM